MIHDTGIPGARFCLGNELEYPTTGDPPAAVIAYRFTIPHTSPISQIP